MYYYGGGYSGGYNNCGCSGTTSYAYPSYGYGYGYGKEEKPDAGK